MDRGESQVSGERIGEYGAGDKIDAGGFWSISEVRAEYRVAKNNDFTDLRVWQASMDLAEHVYLVTDKFPASDRGGLVGQMRRCAVSVPSNIAEGQARGGAKEFGRFLGIARGSLAELRTQTLLAARLRYIPEPESNELVSLNLHVARQLTALRNSLNV
ncbi:MAG: four helix bundle protein [Thermomicrobiales bacterium]|nr:four helix bundle protein [Thermomicrobiales bacterium]